MQSRNIINANNGALTRAIVLAVLAKSNLHWEMHHAQVYALEVQAFKEVTSVVSAEADMELMDMPQTNITLMGLPVIIDNERYPNCLLYTSPSPRDSTSSRMPSSA